MSFNQNVIDTIIDLQSGLQKLVQNCFDTVPLRRRGLFLCL